MKLFGLEIKATGLEKKSGYTTAVSNGNYLSGLIDGVAIARNNRTFGVMYRKNIDIRSCIREINETCLLNGWETRRINGGDESETVVIIPEFINSIKNLRSLKMDIIKNGALFGNVFIRKRKDKGGRTIGFEVLDSRYVSIITDSNLTPLRYTYQNPALQGTIYDVPAEDIVHAKRGKDFDNPCYADSDLEGLVLDVLGEEEANMMNYYWFQNDSIPSALYVLKEGMEEEDKKRTINTIRGQLTGGHQKNKSIVSEAVVDIKQMENGKVDAVFLEYRKYVTEKICAGLGVPRSVLGYIEGVNLSNSDSMYKKFIENTILPWERFIESIFTELLQDFTKTQGNIIFAINSEHIDSLSMKLDISLKAVSNGIWTRNEARLYIGYEESIDELAGELTVPSSTMLLDGVAGVGVEMNPEKMPSAV